MRDSHRMKEKLDLSLDSRQVVSLVIGGLVVLGAVFVLGVVVGKGLAGNAQTRDAPDLLAALDQKAKVSLTFQDELTRKAPPAPTPAPPPPAIAIEPPKAPVAPVHVSAGRDGAPPAPVVAAAPAPEAPPAQPFHASAEIGAPRGAPPEPLPEKPGAAEVSTRSTGLQDAFARATGEDGAFTLQLSASQSRDEADRFAARLRDRGYAPYIVSADVAGKGTWYRVRMGSFPSRDAAQRYLSDFKRETQLDAFVAPR